MATTKGMGTAEVAFGFSFMGYEIAGGWSARIAQAETKPHGHTVVCNCSADRTSVIVMQVDAKAGWTGHGHALWEIGLPDQSIRPGIDLAWTARAVGQADQRQGL